MESPPAEQSLRTAHHQLDAGGAERLFSFYGLEYQGEIPQNPASAFRDTSRELTRAEYDRLLTTARASKQERLALIMETLCATGIRISELRYITVEAARAGRTTIALKGQNSHHLAFHEAVPQAAEIRQKAKKSLPVRYFSQAAVKAFLGGRSGTNSNARIKATQTKKKKGGRGRGEETKKNNLLTVRGGKARQLDPCGKPQGGESKRVFPTISGICSHRPFKKPQEVLHALPMCGGPQQQQNTPILITFQRGGTGAPT